MAKHHSVLLGLPLNIQPYLEKVYAECMRIYPSGTITKWQDLDGPKRQLWINDWYNSVFELDQWHKHNIKGI